MSLVLCKFRSGIQLCFLRRIFRQQEVEILSLPSSENDDDDNIPLAKLTSNSWNDSDSDVPFSVLAKHSC